MVPVQQITTYETDFSKCNKTLISTNIISLTFGYATD